MKATILQGDVMERLRELPDAAVDSIVADPPYELGFMGKAWDSSGIANRSEMWAECLRVLKPGGHLLSFGGSRTYHRMACAIEGAGFEIRDQIQWIYGSGFPKSLDVAKAIDKAAGAENVIGTIPDRWTGKGNTLNFSTDREQSECKVTVPATDAAKQWDGWGTALKPAHEPICVARKPLQGTVAANVQRYGTGALNIDACRIVGDKPGHGPRPDMRGGNYNSSREGEASARRRYAGEGSTNFAATPGPRGGDAAGRWPANVIHDGSDEVIDCFPEEAGAAAPVTVCSGDKSRTAYGAFAGNTDEQGSTFHNDTGSAARFFYCAKASREERNRGCYDVDAKPLLWSSGEKNPGSFQAAGTNRSAENNHPTVKPVDLMRYLVRLVTPKGGTVLDPFTGSGSTGMAALEEGMDFLGIENKAEYVSIAHRRIATVSPLLNTVEVRTFDAADTQTSPAVPIDLLEEEATA